MEQKYIIVLDICEIFIYFLFFKQAKKLQKYRKKIKEKKNEIKERKKNLCRIHFNEVRKSGTLSTFLLSDHENESR